MSAAADLKEGKAEPIRVLEGRDTEYYKVKCKLDKEKEQESVGSKQYIWAASL